MSIYKLYQSLIKSDRLFERGTANVQVEGIAASKLIETRLLDPLPLMVTRFGATELSCILNYIFIKQDFTSNIINILSGVPYFLSFKKGVISNMEIGAGFFPATIKNIERFCELSLNDLPQIDLLGSWLNHEKFLFDKISSDAVCVKLRDLSPVTNIDHSWTRALRGKKVLVIHPFEETIKNQYSKRQLLFRNLDVLPEFELLTLKSVQSVAGNGLSTGFNNWFDALDYMKNEISNIDFDIAIIGCGAYGMPLAAHVKRLGKKAMHLGGETQIMFGIKGKRWEGPTYDYNNLFYNEHWVRPSASDMPPNIDKVENGCYW